MWSTAYQIDALPAGMSRARLRDLSAQPQSQDTLDMTMVAPLESFRSLMTSVEKCIREAEILQLDETAALLRMVMLDVTTRAHGISGEELDVFLFAIKSELHIAEYVNHQEALPPGSDRALSGNG